jgi:sugar phosphate isomerase/epimerase
MTHLKRRDFLKTTVGVGIGLSSLGGLPLCAAEPSKGAPNAEKLGWRLGCEVWTFHFFPLFDAIDKIASLGLHYLETGAGWALTKDRPNVKFGEDSPSAVVSEVKKKLADSGIKMVGYWPNGFPKEVGQCRKVFDFAKGMGVEVLVGEPGEDAFDTLEKLCDEYKMRVAVHNHPNPSHYWNPDTVLKVCKGRSKRIGACADTGHWMRSGLNPVECLKKLEGRIVSFHFKDVNQAGTDAHDVPWGTGVCDVKGMLTEVYRQGIKPPFMVEYEYHWKTSLPEIAQSVAYFDKVAAELAKKGR